jgi:nitrogen fixation protein NifU and related proteins
MTDIRPLYEEMILDHNRRPRNFLKQPPGCTHHAHGFNPVCSDEFDVHLRIEDGIIRDIGFDGAGCAISTASASLMTEAVLGKTVEEAEVLFRGVHRLLTLGGPVPGLGKLAVLDGVHEYPMRVKCATLAWHILRAALENRPETVCTEETVIPGCEAPVID